MQRIASGEGGLPPEPIAGASEPSEGSEVVVREALRLNDRYLIEAVIGFGLCPWAERAISGGELRLGGVELRPRETHSVRPDGVT